ncbi:VCBS repeat-containing protein [Fibrobacter sp. UWT3]|uniref:cadherin-like domain-containing protein n=1 Tax=Fibrobacter sp. UWT3 TaxID=1896225 RepID=UPI000BCBEEC4|nr:cadherin-like domain-containing protein [Fibrobacter sp. UWT3]SOE76777.1 VCBS repeat-containing protein [Fibrobacter sp. UWT3]
MNTKLSMLALAALTGMSMAGVTTVMSFVDGKYTKGEIPPAGWYPYKSPEKSTAVDIDTSTTSTSKRITAIVSKTVESSAGVSVAWKAKDAAIDLSAYKGVCLTYKSTFDFRLDFKQSSVKDYNYNGVIVPAQSSLDTLFIAFADAKQEDWGDETTVVALDLTKQTGLQFGYKTALAKMTGNGNTNIIDIAAITLGSSCSNHAPTLKTGVEADDVAELLEGDTLKVAFKDIFEDADEDNLNIVLTAGEGLVDLTGKKSYSLSDVAMLGSVPNPAEGTTAKVTFVASDAAASVTYSITATLVDRANAPVAVNDTYEAVEDSVLTVGVTKGLLVNDYDADKDNFKVSSYTQPENGTVAVTVGTGAFTYTPNADFHGTDAFTYTIADATGLESEPATVTITVKNVDDPATVTVVDSTIYIGDIVDGAAANFAKGIAVVEDFPSFDIFIPDTSVIFADPDVLGSDFPVNARSLKGVVSVEYMPVAGNHVITVTAVPDANGDDVIQLFAVDGKDTVSFDILVTVTEVPDLPKAFADTFEVVQDSLNFIPAAKGLLVNDVNPDGKSALKAILATQAEHGTVTVDTTGAFTYEAGDYEGEDSFTYVIRNAEGQESEAATVVLNVTYKNKAPVIVAADTVGSALLALKEDFATGITFKATEVKTWFEDPDGPTAKMTYAVSSPDSIVSVTMNASFAMTVRAVKDACGESFIDVIATDSLKASTTFKLPVKVSCINDKPMRIGGATDTVPVPAAGWRKAFGVFELFEDPDDSVLVMSVTSVDRFLNATVEGDSLIITLKDETQYLQNHVQYIVKVMATDEGGAASIAKSLVFMFDPNAGIAQVAAPAKMGWQNAILANRGSAMMFDMQGRVMWQAKLPVSEADVRNAAAQVQGRKILMVNRQTWTIK